MTGIFHRGVFDLPWWGVILVALGLTHITIAAVTIYLHRCQAHRAVELHPLASHFFRAWLWLTTGMVTREWAAVHRKHHAKCETAEDPHSPQILGINRVLWGGVFLYVEEAARADTVNRYGHGTPDDWLERAVYAKFRFLGVSSMGLIDVVLFGILPGLAIFAIQMVWIPFWAAGVINGLGHYWGYRHWPTPDASANIVPWGILIGGEELHNNHHAYPTSAKLSNKWYEFDIGWLYIRALQFVGLATVKHLAPAPHAVNPAGIVDPVTLGAVIRCRYEVLSNYAKSFRTAYRDELAALRRTSKREARRLEAVRPWLDLDEKMLREAERTAIADALWTSARLRMMYVMRHELAAMWGRSFATREQLVRQLQDWCRRAEASGIVPLVEFSEALRRYA